MRIVIAGAGDVGTHLAKLLSLENQEIVLVDSDRSKLGVLDSNYNLMTLVGGPASLKTLQEASAGKADLFIAVTPFEATNITACAMANWLGAKSTVARIDNYEMMTERPAEFFRTIGVDHTIYPEYLAAEEILTALRHSWARHWFELHGGEIILVGVKVHSGASIIGQELRNLTRVNHNFHVSAIRRRHESIIPRGDDIILENDIVYFTSTREHIDDIRRLCGKEYYKVKRVTIMGGSRIAIRLIALAGNEYKFKIIDNDQARCHYLAETLPDGVEIIHGDARDNDVLTEADIAHTDAFVALSDSSEANILACLTAKEFGVNKSVAEVENIQFVGEAEALNIGTVINKKLLASAKIFQLLLDADGSTSRCLAFTDAEVAQIETRPGSKITSAPIKNLKLSREMTLAGIIRDGKGMLVSGNTVVQPGDQAVVFCLGGYLHEIERLFT
ncbi:MAG: Trk system potassium transporter TrkA [Muribaculaceae bacterium]|nr:Trk system potassium transporter TrkA [Muribaculaceae bacterium]